MYYISAAEIYAINEDILGERPLLFDRYLLRSAVARPWLKAFGKEAYPTLMEKAAALLHALAHDHLFADGNKRTATQATRHFLEGNNVDVMWDETDVYEFVRQIAEGKRDIADIALWLGDNTQ